MDLEFVLVGTVVLTAGLVFCYNLGMEKPKRHVERELRQDSAGLINPPIDNDTLSQKQAELYGRAIYQNDAKAAKQLTQLFDDSMTMQYLD